MADELSPAERAAIAAYTGPVTRIPQGQASEIAQRLAAGLHWRDRQESGRRMFARSQRFAALKRREEAGDAPEPKPAPVLVMVTAPTKVVAKAKRKHVSEATGAAAARSARRAEHEERTRVLMLNGVSRADIARALGVSLGTVDRHIATARNRGELPPAEPRVRVYVRPVKTLTLAEKRAVMAERHAKVLGMFLAGMTRPEMAKALGVSRALIDNDMEALRKADPSLPAGKQGRPRRLGRPVA